MKLRLLITLFTILFLGIGCSSDKNVPAVSDAEDAVDQVLGVASEIEEEEQMPTKRVDFSGNDSVYRFSAVIADEFEVEYVPEIQSINIYDPSLEKESDREKSQIFVRFFEASSFLTLSTVDILNQEETESKGRDVVRYEIAKKSSVLDFPNQPSWRNEQHKLIDIRYRKGSPSFFYVFSYNPEYPEQDFEKFIQSLVFHNDAESFVKPISRADERITKKPFGIFVTPEDSPVEPEKFTGYHTGIDYEIFDDEEDISVQVSAICGGTLLQKRNADGYGGLLVQECEREGQDLRVIYGHMAILSTAQSINDYISPGEEIGLLAEVGQYTDNERKHLHLGAHKGTRVDIRGYVDNTDDLEKWLDFLAP
jgi:hypothetical protein